jgi:hypothetical protein
VSHKSSQGNWIISAYIEYSEITFWDKFRFVPRGIQNCYT